MVLSSNRPLRAVTGDRPLSHLESVLVKARYELVYQWALIQFYRGGELNF